MWADVCGPLLETPGPTTQTFAQIKWDLQFAGANELLAPLESGAVEVRIHEHRMPWQAMIRARAGWMGKPVLHLRGLRYDNEKALQLLVWKTAVQLFDLQIRQGLWRMRSVLSATQQKDFDQALAGGLDQLQAFIKSVPGTWRDEKVRRLALLEADLYKVLDDLPLLQAKDILPAQDGGDSWPLGLVVGVDQSKSIRPNLKDFEQFRATHRMPDLGKRQGLNILFNYYMNFLKRASLVAMLLTAPPALYSADWTGSQSPPQQTLVQQNQQRVIAEANKLKMLIEKYKKLGQHEKVAELEQDLQDLYELYPWLQKG